jgi:hypothetical protein
MDYFEMLTADNLHEISKYLSTYNMRCLGSVNKKLNDSIIGATARERVKEKARYHMLNYMQAMEDVNIADGLLNALDVYFAQDLIPNIGYDWEIGPAIYMTVAERELLLNEINYTDSGTDVGYGRRICICGKIIDGRRIGSHRRSKAHLEAVEEKLYERLNEVESKDTINKIART